MIIQLDSELNNKNVFSIQYTLFSSLLRAKINYINNIFSICYFQ